MILNLKKVDKNLIVSFSGELDHHTAAELRRRIDSYYSNKRFKNIILDLKNLEFMDSSGIGFIMGRHKLASQNNGKLYLINVNSRIEKILKIAGVLKIINSFNNEEEALDNIAEEA